MAKCGDFSHELVDVDTRADFDGMRVVRCTIVALNPMTNTADVELGETPLTIGSPDELVDTECPDIPVFDGDGWSDDELRRRMNDVPIFYHCQGSTGTIQELIMGHMAFSIPQPELEYPAASYEEIAIRHAEILREKVYLVFIPPTAADKADGIKGYRYIFGHSDRNDVAPCKSEYLCFRLTYQYEDDMDEDGFGHAKYPEYTIVHIFDPIRGKVFDGLEPYGITFPCIASSITDKAQAIVIDENTNPLDLEFLDYLHEMDALFPDAFVYIEPNYPADSGGYYIPPTNCNAYKPLRLCWLTHFFDEGLQLQLPSPEPTTSWIQPWHTYIQVAFELETWGGGEYNYSQGWYGGIRTFGQYINEDYYPIITIFGPVYDFPTCVGDNGYSPYEVTNKVHFCDPIGFGISKGYIVSNGGAEEGILFCYGLMDFATDGVSDSLEIRYYVPWQKDEPWFTANLSGSFPGYSSSTYGPIFIESIYNSSMLVGRKGVYAINTILHYLSSDLDDFEIKVNFGYNPLWFYGAVHPDVSFVGRYTDKVNYLPRASAYCEEQITEMWELYAYLYPEYGPTYPRGHLSVLVLDVVE